MIPAHLQFNHDRRDRDHHHQLHHPNQHKQISWDHNLLNITIISIKTFCWPWRSATRDVLNCNKSFTNQIQDFYKSNIWFWKSVYTIFHSFKAMLFPDLKFHYCVFVHRAPIKIANNFTPLSISWSRLPNCLNDLQLEILTVQRVRVVNISKQKWSIFGNENG